MSDQKCKCCESEKTLSADFLSYAICSNCLNSALSDFLKKSQKPKGGQKPAGDAPDSLKDYSLGFGKHRGVNILDVPPDYLRWCLENFNGLRDVDIFNEALQVMTGEKVANPAAGSDPKSAPAPKAQATSSANSPTTNTTTSSVGGEVPIMVNEEEEEVTEDFPF